MLNTLREPYQVSLAIQSVQVAQIFIPMLRRSLKAEKGLNLS